MKTGALWRVAFGIVVVMALADAMLASAEFQKELAAAKAEFGEVSKRCAETGGGK